MAAEIYYFTGTGNSLFAAREIQKRLPKSRLIPIAGIIDQTRIKTRESVVGLVFPVQALTIPILVKRFLRMADFSSSEYLFAIATRQNTVFRGFEAIDWILKRQKKRLDARFILNMCSSDARHVGYVTPDEDEIHLKEEAALKKLDVIQDVVNRRTLAREQDTEYIVRPGFLSEKIILGCMAASGVLGGVNYFYADSACTGCGVCERVCPSRKISLNGKAPVWQRSVLCYMCFACLNFCPARSVQIKSIPGVKSATQENGRYPHPYATMQDIAAQKEHPPQ